jgi:hypothetical protein
MKMKTARMPLVYAKSRRRPSDLQMALRASALRGVLTGRFTFLHKPFMSEELLQRSTV